MNIEDENNEESDDSFFSGSHAPVLQPHPVFSKTIDVLIKGISSAALNPGRDRNYQEAVMERQTAGH